MAFADQARELAEAGGARIAEMEWRIRASTRKRERSKVTPTLLFHFFPGQLVVRRHRTFSKLDPKSSLPYRIRSIRGVFR